jgi:hypothetical protein
MSAPLAPPPMTAIERALALFDSANEADMGGLDLC